MYSLVDQLTNELSTNLQSLCVIKIYFEKYSPMRVTFRKPRICTNRNNHENFNTAAQLGR